MGNDTFTKEEQRLREAFYRDTGKTPEEDAIGGLYAAGYVLLFAVLFTLISLCYLIW